MSNQPPLNPDALEAAADAVIDASFGQELPEAPIDLATAAVSAYLAAAQPEVNSFDPRELNRRGWTCGCEPGNYDSCDECRSACNELARFYNHMMRGTRPFKHWTGHPEVNDA